MKHFILLTSIFFLRIGFTQSILGIWSGELKVEGNSLEIIFKIKKEENKLLTSISVPTQGANDVPMNTTTFENNQLTLSMDNPGIRFEGILVDSVIQGSFKQGGKSIPLLLYKDLQTKEPIARKQDPVKPYPYFEEEVKFYNAKSKINLAGTLTLPNTKGNFPIVILISGSGPQNRNEEILGHKPFLVIADFLTRNGVGVLRYDDRGVGSSEGDFNKATTLDFAEDAEAALRFLKGRKNVDSSKIFIVGHSEGGLVAAIAAARNKNIKGIILLATPTVKGDILLLKQQELIGRAQMTPEAELKKSLTINKDIFQLMELYKDSSTLPMRIANYLKKVYEDLNENERPQGISKDDFIKIQVHQITGPWMKFYLSFDPAPTLKKLQIPVLALYGERDIQVPATLNMGVLMKIQKEGNHPNYEMKEYKKLNHLFQSAESGLPDEYGKIEETFSEQVLLDIVNWIKVVGN